MNYELPKYEKKEYLERYSKEFEVDSVRSSKVASIVFKRPSASSLEFERKVRISERERKNIQQAQTRLRKKNPSFRFRTFLLILSGYICS